MIEIKTMFTADDIVVFLRKNGLDVRKFIEQKVCGKDVWNVNVYRVKNWHTGDWEKAEDVFRRIADKKQKDIYLSNLNKLDFIEVFKK